MKRFYCASKYPKGPLGLYNKPMINENDCYGELTQDA